jgi:tetratricopeptide (TPR) repeat protein
MTHADPAFADLSLAYQHHCQGRLAEAGTLYRAALIRNPDLTEGWINLGLVEMAQRRTDRAIACQREALRLDPASADARNNIGMVHYMQGNLAEAEACFRDALRLAPGHASALLNLGSARQLNNDVDAAEACFRGALKRGADPARAKSNLALAMMEQGRPAEAETLCREALDMLPGHCEARANLALALLTQGKLAEGWAEYEARWDVEAMAAPLPKLPQPRWTGQDLNGETVLLYAEQGFGDVLQFCRYAPMVAQAGGRVVLVVPPALQRLMRTLDGVDQVLSEEDDLLPAFDYHCPLMSLPFAFRTVLETIPRPRQYLHADPSSWAPFLAQRPGLKVGLVWAGRSRTDQPHAVAIDKRRSMRFEDMAPVLTVPGCSFVSLQLGPPARQMQGIEGLIDVSDRLKDWHDTAELIAGLDLVIAVDTAVAHLAGALGRPVWMLNRFDSCWRWLRDRDDTPWYPTMRQFRQRESGNWTDVILRVVLALRDRVEGIC